MSNVIQFLEAVGSKPLSAAEYIESVNALDAQASEKRALLQHDGEALGGLLTDRKMYCAVFAAED